jgi:hypothetical protein
MDHFDVSVWAFEKLADTKWGVIGIKYRPGECLCSIAKSQISMSSRTSSTCDMLMRLQQHL